MDAERIVDLANRIGDFFQAYPDRQEAMDGVAGHIRRYWEPRMRHQLLALVDAGAATGLSDLLAATVKERRAALG
jgi:formate dehydrogenase subunit delta